ncbi:hypothetical protein LPB140_09155 [Sphingorhabdus lutea]|uniref:Divalent metal cation transporter n=2 Tax=Sphingorhabdus lutea TaxID=1913578 RepID=A0A1L3JF53_9SPHN|nr:hypothetical protein LPB140_09155 [Sphingorhabdus lutea]
MGIGKALLQYRPGPAMLVSAAFIGPGTVTICTLSGVKFGYSLLWVMLFATFATIILQNLASHVAIILQKGLGEAILDALPNKLTKILFSIILITALFVGNSAYESGNIAGVMMGINAINPQITPSLLPLLVGGFVILMVFFGAQKWLEKILIAIVVVMSISFLISLIIVKPNFALMMGGFIPNLSDENLFTAIALVGTTIVPYNLFLHAALSKKHWKSADKLTEANVENAVSISLGGLVSMAIIATAAAAFFGNNIEIQSAADMAGQMRPLFGDVAQYALGAGLFAAGLTSAITAPMATAYIACEITGAQGKNYEQILFKSTAILVAAIGTALASLGIKPVEIITIAQFANGLLLPIVALFLMILITSSSALAAHRPGKIKIISGWVILIFCTFLGAKSLLGAESLTHILGLS